MILTFLNSNYYYSKRLVDAVQEENIELVKQIIEKKPTCVNCVPTLMPEWFHIVVDAPRPMYSLYVAVARDNPELIQVLIDGGADVNGVEGRIPLSRAYANKNTNWYAISQLLIENGASLDYVTKYSGGKSFVLQNIVQVRGGAALPGYQAENEDEVIKAFHYAIENCDHSNVNWMSVLQHSVSNDRLEIVKFLLDNGHCDVNDNSDDMTALMFAARDSTLEMVELLLDYGADKSYRDSRGKTAYDYAYEYANSAEKQDIIDVLESTTEGS